MGLEDPWGEVCDRLDSDFNTISLCRAEPFGKDCSNDDRLAGYGKEPLTRGWRLGDRTGVTEVREKILSSVKGFN